MSDEEEPFIREKVADSKPDSYASEDDPSTSVAVDSSFADFSMSMSESEDISFLNPLIPHHADTSVESDSDGAPDINPLTDAQDSSVSESEDISFLNPLVPRDVNSSFDSGSEGPPSINPLSGYQDKDDVMSEGGMDCTNNHEPRNNTTSDSEPLVDYPDSSDDEDYSMVPYSQVSSRVLAPRTPSHPQRIQKRAREPATPPSTLIFGANLSLQPPQIPDAKRRKSLKPSNDSLGQHPTAVDPFGDISSMAQGLSLAPPATIHSAAPPPKPKKATRNKIARSGVRLDVQPASIPVRFQPYTQVHGPLSSTTLADDQLYSSNVAPQPHRSFRAPHGSAPAINRNATPVIPSGSASQGRPPRAPPARQNPGRKQSQESSTSRMHHF
ncbi:hypothetical protein FA15DRAFT_460306 [Coprinopsis marcescibilis]|uniref:Uncharacterized protein n=1 Tax=Coprinopsis marcescibilis TaxID=230819 RepID=A0A5C3K8L7_COPMA|nr:hypothetical protein FA15DRAFT_460306 [Coprinopsis marcescibilis]